VKLSDAGSYVCQLKNPLGEDESTAKASVRKVYQAPNFTQKFTDLQQVHKFKGFHRNKVPESSISQGHSLKESLR
jgi:hypothetical protein